LLPSGIVAFRFGSVGELAAASYLIAALTGVALAVPYEPADAYSSLAALLLVNPAGVFFRNLHFWAGQAAFVLTLLHAADHLRVSTESRVRVGVWARLVLTVALIAFIMLSGFLLRGDADAQQALRILTEATTQIPWVGPALATLVFGAAGSLSIVYVQHAATATIAVWLFVIEHSRRVWPRATSFVTVLLVVTGVSLLVSPGLHDGFDPVVKGPWYFLGLQEVLHWTPWPIVVVAGVAAVLGVLFALRVAAASQAVVIKASLAALAVAYAGLCLVGAFARGENWSWQPGWPRGPGNLRVAWVFASTPGVPVPLPTPLPTVSGRPDGCLVCHRGVAGLGNAHAPQAVGCASCHGGDVLTLDKRRAHAAMELIPGNLATASRTCGQSSCHQSVIPRVEKSVMTTMAGVVAVDRAIFGEPTGAAGGAAPDVRTLGHTPADTHLRQMCAWCHLGVKKTELGPNTENARGGGCVACHLSYERESLAALKDYASRRKAGAADPPTRHPAISLDIGNGQCFGCHSRSGRISTSYEGWHEMHDPPAVASDPNRPMPSLYRVLEDDRVFERVVPDIHHERGLDCIDCHTANEVMGDGKTHASKRAQLRIVCEDCHARPGAMLASVPAARLDPESRRLLALRKWIVAADEQHGVGRSGEPMVNVVVDAQGRAQMIRKRTGKRLKLQPMAAVCAEGGGHERLSCGSCHSAWAPRCVTCHTSYDPKGEGFDVLADADVKGAWTEKAGPFVANAPTLGVRGAAMPGGKDSIDTFVPGMIMTVDRAMNGGEKPDVLFWRLYARIEPHTTRREARSCESCHSDPEALGYGRGVLRLEKVAPGVGRWLFAPAAPASPNDLLAADAWIPFLGTRSDKVSTTDDVRPFSVEEQRRILTVGACLTCHKADSALMRGSVHDFDALIAARRPVCLMPAWR
jgi:quinol-cytochrome oxidoreductase complex cytochrome b subunit